MRDLDPSLNHGLDAGKKTQHTARRAFHARSLVINKDGVRDRMCVSKELFRSTQSLLEDIHRLDQIVEGRAAVRVEERGVRLFDINYL